MQLCGHPGRRGLSRSLTILPFRIRWLHGWACPNAGRVMLLTVVRLRGVKARGAVETSSASWCVLMVVRLFKGFLLFFKLWPGLFRLEFAEDIAVSAGARDETHALLVRRISKSRATLRWAGM